MFLDRVEAEAHFCDRILAALSQEDCKVSEGGFLSGSVNTELFRTRRSTSIGSDVNVKWLGPSACNWKGIWFVDLHGSPYGPRNVRETCAKRALLARFAHIKSKFLARFREFVYYVVSTFLTHLIHCVNCAFYVRKLCVLCARFMCLNCA